MDDQYNGVLFNVHTEVGQYGREKQYGDVLERILKEKNIRFEREVRIGDSGNILDFIIEEKILLELKIGKIRISIIRIIRTIRIFVS